MKANPPAALNSTARLTNVSPNTVNKLLEDVGVECSAYLFFNMVKLPCKRIQVDEIWSFCGMKEKRVPAELKYRFADGALAAETGKWQVQLDESALDGSKKALLVLLPEAEEKGLFGIKCEKQETMVVFSLGQYVGLNQVQMMSFSIDGGPVEQIGVRPGADGGAVNITAGVSVPSGNVDNVLSRLFVQKLFGAKRLVVKFAPYRKAPAERIFDVTGIEEAITATNGLCF